MNIETLTTASNIDFASKFESTTHNLNFLPIEVCKPWQLAS